MLGFVQSIRGSICIKRSCKCRILHQSSSAILPPSVFNLIVLTLNIVTATSSLVQALGFLILFSASHRSFTGAIMTMFRYCENLDCWKSVPICYDELCTACFRSNSWAQDIKIDSNCELIDTSNGSRFHSLSYLSIADRNTITDDDCKTFMVSYYYYLANWIIRENLANFSTLTKELSHPIETTSSSSATNETLHMTVNQKSRRSVRGVSSLAAAKSFNHYDPYSRKQEKDKNKRSCISCYNKRKVTISSC